MNLRIEKKKILYGILFPLFFLTENLMTPDHRPEMCTISRKIQEWRKGYDTGFCLSQTLVLHKMYMRQ